MLKLQSHMMIYDVYMLAFDSKKGRLKSIVLLIYKIVSDLSLLVYILLCDLDSYIAAFEFKTGIHRGQSRDNTLVVAFSYLPKIHIRAYNSRIVPVETSIYYIINSRDVEF